jgi:hypothetical protein
LKLRKRVFLPASIASHCSIVGCTSNMPPSTSTPADNNWTKPDSKYRVRPHQTVGLVSFVLVQVLWNNVMKQYGLQITKDMTPIQLNHPMKVRIVLKRLTLSIIYKLAPIIQLYV